MDEVSPSVPYLLDYYNTRHIPCNCRARFINTVRHKNMKALQDHIVADGRNRIRGSESFAKRKKEIQEEMNQARKEEIESAVWFHKKLILWGIDRASTMKAEEEICPMEGLYLKSK